MIMSVAACSKSKMAAPMEYFAAIKVLVSPPSKSSDPQVGSTEGPIDDATRFNHSLRASLVKLHLAIESDKRCRNLSTALGSLFTDWKERLAGCEDVRWMHVEHCLGLLRGLKDAVHTQMVEFREEQRRRDLESVKPGPNDAPPLSPDTFSIGQQKDLTTVLQFIVCLGLVPCLQHGVGIPMERRSGFGQLLAGRQQMQDSDERLKAVVRALVECIQQPSLGGLIMTRHLGDLLAALLQICYSEKSSHHQPSINPGTDDSPGEKKPSEEVEATNTVKCKDVKDTENKSELPSKPLFDNPGSIASRSETDSHGSETSTSASDSQATGSKGQSAEQTKLQTSDSSDVEFFQSQLKRLLQKSFQPMVIRELLFLQGGPGTQTLKRAGKQDGDSRSKTRQNPLPRAPPWLRQECGRLLTERLMRPKGIQWVLRGLLDIGAGGVGGTSTASTPDWNKCDAIAHLISDCPLQGNSVEKYYKVVCPQILELLHFKDQVLLKQVLRVASSCIVAMTTKHSQLAASFLIGPLLEPLRATLHERVEEANREGAVVTLMDEPVLSQCILDLHYLFVVSTQSASCLLEAVGSVIQPLFHLLCFAKQGVCNLRSALDDILQTFFRNSDKQVALQYLKHIAFLQQDSPPSRMHSGVKIVPGKDGGAVVMFRPDVRADELFTEGLMSQEQMATTVVELVTKLKMEGLAGDFFIIVLKELTSITSSKPPSSSKSPNLGNLASGSSRTLLDLEEGQESQVAHLQHSLQVLAVLSRLCEDLGPEVLENTSQMLEFARATVDRAASALDHQGETFDVFETETLTLAFGLVSAILNGDLEKKVTSEHRQALMDLLPSLEKISNEHTVEPLQRTATDLRIAIATHGAVWSESMREATEQLRSSSIFAGSVAEKSQEVKKRVTDTKYQASTCRTGSSNTQSDVGVSSNQNQNENQYEAVAGISPPGNQQDTPPTKTSTVDGSGQQLPTEQNNENAVSENFDQAFQELFDPLLPTRGHALRVLGKLLLARDPKAIQKRDMLVGIFEENLSHEDSYIYLSAVQALSCIADAFPDRVIPHLCQEFVACQQGDKTKKRVVRTVETRLKLGEALVRATRSLGELAPHYSKVLLGAFLQGAQDTDAAVRASSLSNMAEVCKLLRFSLGSNIHEILNCLLTILRSDPEVQVRRACVLVLTLILRGLGKDAIQMLESLMRDIYRSLKLALTSEKDDVIRLHCQLALEEIDIIMREYLFPKQTLSKKITVLP